MSFLLSSSVPSNGAVDIEINKSLELTFNKNVSVSSIEENSIAVIDINTGKIVPTTVSRAPLDRTKVLIVPSEYFTENTQYKIQIIGSDVSLGFYLEAEDGEYIVDTVSITFTTGDNVYKIDTELEKEAQSLTLEGDLFLPTNVKALGYDFTLTRVRPKNHTINNLVNLTGDNSVRFTFNKNLYTGASDYTYWADVNPYPILDSDIYLASNSTLHLGTNTGIAIPDYGITITGADLLVTFSGALPNNVAISIGLNSDILSEDNEGYGGNMDYTIHTQLYPAVKAVESIKREVRFAAADFHDDFINALLFKNSIYLWERFGRGLNLTNLPFAGMQYIINSTVLNLIEDKDLEKYILGGSRKRLADLDISYTSLVGKLAMKAIRLQKAIDLNLESLNKGWQVRTGVLNSYLAIADSVNRLWYNVSNRYTDPLYKYAQDNIPASNVSLNRHAKTNSPYNIL